MAQKHLSAFLIFMVATCLLSCSGRSTSTNSSDQSSSYSTADLENSKQVILYYENSISLIHSMVPEKGINAMLSYINKDKLNDENLPSLNLPNLTEDELSCLLNPGAFFQEDVRNKLKLCYAHLFETILSFHKNFDYFIANNENMSIGEKQQVAQEGYDLSVAVSQYKQDIYDALAPVVDDAFFMLLENSSARKQTMIMKQMNIDMLSILNLYARGSRADVVLIDERANKLHADLMLAKELNNDAVDESTAKLFHEYLQAVELFLNQTKAVRSTDCFSEESYDMLSNAYATSVV